MRAGKSRIALAALLIAIGGCSKELNERNVREFVDDADHAYLAGHAADICKMRSDDFKFSGSTFELAKGRTVASLAEAMALDAEQHAAGERTSAQVVTMNAHEYCLMAVESRVAYRRVNLVRTALEITVSPDHKQAAVRAHYVEKAPQYGYGESSVSARDQVEHQVGTLQTETDEESVVTQDASGKLVFSSTHAISRQFRVPQERDARL
jgi:hypothetical protein